MADTHADNQVPPWPICSYRGEETGSLCNGKQADGFGHCLAHLKPDQLDQALQRLQPGIGLDASGTPINADLLAHILRAVRGPDGRPVFGSVSFAEARFTEDVSFDAAQFAGSASFDRAQFAGWENRFAAAQFTGDASFDGAQFTGFAWFDDAQFTGYARFIGTRFAEHARFDGAQFNGDALFVGAKFAGSVLFRGAQFTNDASFNGAECRGEALFSGARCRGEVQFEDVKFEKATSLGPLAAGSVSLDRAVFVSPMVIEAAAASVSCRDTTWNAGVTLRLRYTAVDLERATFTAPSFLSGSDQPFESPYIWPPNDEQAGPLNEDQVRNRARGERGESLDLWVPILTSMRGSDAANLSITDVNLSRCRFAGARLLDQLRLEGRCVFDHPPRGVRTGWAWPPAWRWSRRQSLAEERSWRATTRKYTGWADERSIEAAEVRPERLAGLYRQLRKAHEDAKNEPGAADFYYGEMEMRRKATTTPPGERAILWLYWLISGYGLRALRSLAALGILGVVVTTALTGWGLAASAPPQHLTGTITSGAGNRTRIDATLNTATPRLPPAGQRWTAPRARIALEVTLDSVVFHTTDQPLTTAGTWTTDAARILGPVLLALALLALRNRVKR